MLRVVSIFEDISIIAMGVSQEDGTISIRSNHSEREEKRHGRADD